MNNDTDTAYYNFADIPPISTYLVEHSSYSRNIDETNYKRSTIIPSSTIELASDILCAPSTSFVCYANNLFRQGYIPRHLNVIEKIVANKENAYAECVASRILNYYGIGTAYNTLSIDDSNNYHVISVKTTLAKPVRIDISSNLKYRNLQDWIDAIHSSYQDTDKATNLTQQLIMSYLVRVGILNDLDFRSDHWLITDNGPANIDMEMSLRKPINVNNAHFLSNIRYIADNYPDIVDKFTHRTAQLISSTDNSSDLEKIIKNGVYNDYGVYANMLNIARQNIAETTSQLTEKSAIKER